MKTGEKMLDDASVRARRAVPDLDVSAVLESGHAADALLKQASDASVVVLGFPGQE